MTTYADQTWEWVAQPLRELRERCRAEPEVSWEEQFGQFVGELGLSSADQHPVVAAVAERVAVESDPVAFVADDSFDAVVHEIVVASTVEHEQAAEHGGGTAAEADLTAVAEADPAAVADDAVVTIGLPAVHDLVASQPGVTAGEDLPAALAVALAYRLTAQPDPYGTALSTALADHLERWTAAHPEPAGAFYALFDVHAQVAHQWVEQAVAAHAGEMPAPVPVAAAPTAAAGAEPAAAAASTGDDTTGTDTAEEEAFADLFGEPDDSPSPSAGAYLMPDVVEQFLRDVPGAEGLTPDQINDAIREALAESHGSTP